VKATKEASTFLELLSQIIPQYLFHLARYKNDQSKSLKWMEVEVVLIILYLIKMINPFSSTFFILTLLFLWNNLLSKLLIRFANYNYNFVDDLTLIECDEYLKLIINSRDNSLNE